MSSKQKSKLESKSKKKGDSCSSMKDIEVDERIQTCGECKKEVTDEGLECEICERWFHCACQGVSTDTYKVLEQECIHWYCTSCNKRVAKLVKTVAKLEERQDKLEEELNHTRNEVREVKEAVSKLDGVKEEIKRIDLKVNDFVDKQGETGASNQNVMKREDVLEEIKVERKKWSFDENSMEIKQDKNLFNNLSILPSYWSIYINPEHLY